MKRLFVLLVLAMLIFTNPVRATSDPYPDWDWNGVQWVYVGDGDPIDPPPPPPR